MVLRFANSDYLPSIKSHDFIRSGLPLGANLFEGSVYSNGRYSISIWWWRHTCWRSLEYHPRASGQGGRKLDPLSIQGKPRGWWQSIRSPRLGSIVQLTMHRDYRCSVPKKPQIGSVPLQHGHKRLDLNPWLVFRSCAKKSCSKQFTDMTSSETGLDENYRGNWN